VKNTKPVKGIFAKSYTLVLEELVPQPTISYQSIHNAYIMSMLPFGKRIESFQYKKRF